VIVESFGKLYTQHNEIVAEGSCLVDMERGSITMRPIVDTPLISRQRGNLRLELDDGTELTIREGIIRFRLNVAGAPPGPAYRLFVAGGGTPSAQKAAE
jgi:hypothetical protein